MGNGNCDKAPYAFCCGVGTSCDCSKGMSSSGQCDSAAYAFCCMEGTKCQCDLPPFMAEAEEPEDPEPCRGCPGKEASADERAVCCSSLLMLSSNFRRSSCCSMRV